MTRRPRERGLELAVMLVMALLVVHGCGRIRELPLGTSSFTTSLAAVEEALDTDDVDAAVERARRFERRFPGEVASGLLGEALWRSGRLNEAEGHLRRAAEQGDPRGSLGMSRVAISRGRWQQAREWAEAAGGGREARALLLTIALGRGDGAAVRRAAEALAEDPAPEQEPWSRLAASIVEAGPPGAWEGPAGTVPIRASPAGWLVEARFAGRPVRLRLALGENRSWIRRRPVDGEESGAGAGHTLVVGTLALGPMQRSRTHLEARSLPSSGAELPAELDGELAADLLADLRWSLDPGVPRLVVAPDDGLGWDAPTPPTSLGREVLRPPEATDVQWLSVRVLREGLDAQWLLVPRIEVRTAGEVRAMASLLDWGRDSVIDDDALADLGGTVGDSGVAIQARLGAWWPSLRLGVADLAPLAAGGRVAPRMSLGGELFRGWRLLWDPGARQLGLVPGTPAADASEVEDLPGGGAR